jgi:hypothetical protein
MDTPVRRRWFQLGTLLPLLMALAIVADLAGRFLPLDLVAFRVWEPALRTTFGAPGPFEPGKTARKSQAYGDLAALGNLRQLRQYHDEEFHADRLGYRNGYDIDRARYAGIVIGDSFAVAHAEPEAETLAGQLTRLAGGRFYNAGSNLAAGPLSPDFLASFAATFQMRSGVVVYELLERVSRGAPPGPPAVGATATVLPPSFRTWWVGVAHRFSPWTESPLHIATIRALKSLQDDVLEPNSYAGNVARGKLANGDEMLFLPADLDPYGDPQPAITAWSDFLNRYAGELQKRDLRLVVLLVPNKYTVYGPLTLGGPREAEGARLLAGLADRLRASGLPVVDSTPLFVAQAALRLPRHEYLYWRDDTHWNAAGIELAAEAGSREMGALR